MNKHKVVARGTPATLRRINQCNFCPFDAKAKKGRTAQANRLFEEKTGRKIIDRDSRAAKPNHWCQE